MKFRPDRWSGLSFPDSSAAGPANNPVLPAGRIRNAKRSRNGSILQPVGPPENRELDRSRFAGVASAN